MYRIIIVDDEIDIRVGMSSIINWKDHGYEMVGTAENGKKALSLCESVSPHLVISDIRMPFMDGIQLASSIRKQWPDVKVLLLSGFSDFEYAKQAIQYGVSSYILKPVDVNELAEELKKIKKSLDHLHLNSASISLKESQGSKLTGIDQILSYIIDHSSENLSLRLLGEIFFLSDFYIGKLIKKYTGLTFNEYLNYLRIENAKYMLRNSDLSIHEIIERTGYKFPDHFYRNFKKYVKLSPKKYQENIMS